MNAFEALRAGFREIAANKFRSALSFSAVSVGVASLLYTLAQTSGMQRSLDQYLALTGPGRLTVAPLQNYASKGLSPGLTYADAQAIEAELPDLYMVDARSENWGLDLYVDGKRLRGLHVLGATPEFRKRDWVYSLRGRFLSQSDLERRSQVAVMVLPAGWRHKPFWADLWNRGGDYEAFAKHHDWLGRSIRMKDSFFTVVGVLRPPPRDLDPRWDSWNTPEVIVPLTAYQDRLGWEKLPDSVQKLEIDTGNEKTLPQRSRQISAILLRRHRGEKDFQITNERETIDGEMEDMRKYVRSALALGLVALLAGGIGIMNVTLATIFSRVKEIGVRRAVGARRGDILAQFLLEAALLGAAGGAAGVLLGAVGIAWLSRMMANFGQQREVASVSWLHCLALVALASLLSAAFAAFPAWQASRLDPVEALRAES
ncbi:MAG: ABC transporter permease [Elusimicrobia bacterium]|nr:ABC transporter permease [Elusimicrobiota bacterium]MDE2236656.1 ABC transporter permease [Elusimicrobiota bacterium]MDE2425380.1 ABC transporter permease [Elusimicrobiota bacterium]